MNTMEICWFSKTKWKKQFNNKLSINLDMISVNKLE
jgi:hypothetical protein